LSRLDEVAVQTGARLCIIDPLTGFLDNGVNLGSDQSVRAAIAPLADFADRRALALPMVRHLSKNNSGHALYRGLHSIGFAAFCRVSWIVGRDPRNPDLFVLAQTKNNFDPPASSLAYRIVKHANGAARIEWLGTSLWADDDLVSLPKRYRRRLRAMQFLRMALKDGPRRTRELWEQGRQLGLAQRTLGRARHELKIRTVRVGPFGPKQDVYWLLPDQKLPAELDANAAGLDEFFQKLEEEYPGRTPLDEM
jgi:hypothetical protein